MRAKRVFWEGLASLLDAGIPIATALDQLESGAEGGFRDSARHLVDTVRAGRAVWEGMAGRPGHFRRFEIELVRAGEAGGTLGSVARRLAAEEERNERIRGTLLRTLAYPIFVIHVIPLPLTIGRLMNRGLFSFLSGYVSWLLPLYLVAGVLWWLFRSAGTRASVGRGVLAVPFLGGILRDLAMVRWARAWAALEDAGIPADACVLRSAAVVGYSHLEAALAAPAARLAAGSSRVEAFAGVPLHGEIRDALARGEVSGSLTESLDKAAEMMEHSAGVRIDTFLGVAPAVAILAVGAVVGWVVINMYSGMYRGL